MHDQRYKQEFLSRAERHCAAEGNRFTQKRQRVLSVLLDAHQPLSAYEVVEAYTASYSEAIPAMSVYRILDFLEQAHFVHKLQSTQKYTVCAHLPGCDHESTQFLICDACHDVEEVHLSDDVLKQLRRGMGGFSLNISALELHGLCSSCQK